MQDTLNNIIDGLVQITVAAIAGGGTIGMITIRGNRKRNKEQSDATDEQTNDLKKFFTTKFSEIEIRLVDVEVSQRKSAIMTKKAFISTLLREYDEANEETKPWIEEKITYEANRYFELGGNSYIADELDNRRIKYEQ